MSRLTRGAGIAAALLCTLTAVSSAQGNNTTFNIAAGLSLPTGDFGEGSNVGYNIMAGIGAQQRGSPLGFRIEGLFTEFDAEWANNKTRVTAGSANILYDLTTQSRGSGSNLYFIGGIGYYN